MVALGEARGGAGSIKAGPHEREPRRSGRKAGVGRRHLPNRPKVKMTNTQLKHKRNELLEIRRSRSGRWNGFGLDDDPCLQQRLYRGANSPMSAGNPDEPVMGVGTGAVDTETHAAEPRSRQHLDGVGPVEREAVRCERRSLAKLSQKGGRFMKRGLTTPDDDRSRARLDGVQERRETRHRSAFRPEAIQLARVAVRVDATSMVSAFMFEPYRIQKSQPFDYAVRMMDSVMDMLNGLSAAGLNHWGG